MEYVHGILFFLLIAFLFYVGMVFRLFRRRSEARSLVVPERINQEMLEILFEHNVLSDNNWVLTKGYVENSSDNNPCAVYCGLEHGNVMLVNENTKSIIAPDTLEDPSVGFESIDGARKYETSGSAGFSILSWSDSLSSYVWNVSSAQFDKKIIQAAS
jgi:hypothetical protein